MGVVSLDGVIISVIFSFISTNIDDIFVLMLLFSQVNQRLKSRHVVIGQYLGIGTLTMISIIGAVGISSFPQKYIGILGVVPIYLGIKNYIDYKKEKSDNKENSFKVHDAENILQSNKWVMHYKKFINLNSLKVAGITVANGGDNIGIYIPLLAGMNMIDMLITIFIFIILIALWCFIGYRLAEYPFIHKYIERYKHILIPIVFIALGFSIIIGNGTVNIILD